MQYRTLECKHKLDSLGHRAREGEKERQGEHCKKNPREQNGGVTKGLRALRMSAMFKSRAVRVLLVLLESGVIFAISSLRPWWQRCQGEFRQILELRNKVVQWKADALLIFRNTIH